MHPSHLRAAMLRETLRRVELSAKMSPKDRSLAELKRTLRLKIEALEAEAERADADQDHSP
jgi:hypothetical protein